MSKSNFSDTWRVPFRRERSRPAWEDVFRAIDGCESGMREHVILALLWHTGIRLGALRAIDVADYDADDRVIEIRHRLETGTPLKNKSAGVRDVNVSPNYASMLNAYIKHHGPSARKPSCAGTCSKSF